jgi:hypothetical protein
MDHLIGYVIVAIVLIAIGYRWYQGYVAHEANQAIRRMDKRDRDR